MRRYVLGLIAMAAIVTGMTACGNGTENASLQQQQHRQQQIRQRNDAPIVTPYQRQTKATPAKSNKAKAASPKPQAVEKPELRNDIKGIYVSAYALANERKRRDLIQLIERTDLNAMVIDVKDDYGRLTYKSMDPDLSRYQPDRPAPIRNVQQLLRSLKKQDIYTIARIVAFKDPNLANAEASLAMQSKAGGVWKDRNGAAWVDPYNERVWDYNIAVAQEAARLGFDEIQFDYVRFPENGDKVNREVNFAHAQGRAKAEAIAEFLSRARQALQPYPVRLSADVFGLTTTQKDDMGIGQKWLLFADEVDVVSPMTYPSHYAEGTYGIAYPDLQPKPLIKQAMKDALAQNETLRQAGRKPASLRPWLQSFTAAWLEPHRDYDARAVREQIEALEELGIRQYLLWNQACEYNVE